MREIDRRKRRKVLLHTYGGPIMKSRPKEMTKAGGQFVYILDEETINV